MKKVKMDNMWEDYRIEKKLWFELVLLVRATSAAIVVPGVNEYLRPWAGLL